MTPKQIYLERALKRIYEAGDYDIDCNFTGDLMARCIDAGLDVNAAQTQYPALTQHFTVCENCAAEYQIMVDLATASAETTPLSVPIPPRPDRQTASLWPQIKTAFSVRFSGFAPQAQVALARGIDLGVDPVEVALGDALVVELDVGINERDAAMRDLFCNVTAADSLLEQHLEGSSTWLLSAEGINSIHEGAISDLGDVVFQRLETEQSYTLRLLVAGEDYVITSIHLP